MDKDSKKKSVLITIVAVAVLTVVALGATYAYFAASIGTGSTTNVSVVSKTTDTLSFNAGTTLSIVATQQNFGSGAGNLTSNSVATASLVANNTATATYCYTVNLVIASNTFVYTSGTTPEITFSITKNSTSLLSNYDITNKSTTIQIPTTSGGSTYIHQLSATAGATATDTFNSNITFVNLNSSQKNNENKSLSATIQFTKVNCS